MSWTIKQVRGHVEVPAEERRAVALYDTLPPRPGELWFLSACAHTALAGLADQAGSGMSAAEAASEAETAVARLHQAVAMGYRNADASRNADALALTLVMEKTTTASIAMTTT